ncbi:MAG: hypothetical protein MJZ05_01420 [Fibrobacter sp.]|nr:hypothetical protein [Fibrobacter sp.]MCQ2125546.1 hypothetical protein [Fibrobacter sp.]
MRNINFSTDISENDDLDKLDFSKLEELTPRADSWDKVCARLDAEQAAPKKSNIISFRAIYSAIPLAASFALVGLSAWLAAFNTIDDQTISMSTMESSDTVAWFNSLGEDDSEDFDLMENSTAINYLMKE